MTQVRCKVCANEPRSSQLHCHECKGSTWVEDPTQNKCTHPNESYDPMCGGWECPDCGDSGPL